MNNHILFFIIFGSTEIFKIFKIIQYAKRKNLGVAVVVSSQWTIYSELYVI
jgi:spore coat polysaccharide biosynthesis predicted glycosyltransferase SpsG